MSDPPLVRVRLKYPDLDSFVERFAPNVTRGGVFLTAREPKPVGSVVSFEISLMTGGPVLVGQGRVTWVKPFSPTEPRLPHGMGVQFTRLDPACRPVLERLLDRRATNLRRTGGLQPELVNDGVSRPMGATPRARLPSSEFDRVDEALVKRAVDRARLLSSRTSGEVETLLAREAPPKAPSIAEAIAGLARYLPGRRAAPSRAISPTPAAAEAGGERSVGVEEHAPAKEEKAHADDAAAHEATAGEPLLATSGDGS